MRNTLNQGQRKQLIEEYLRRSNAGEPSSQNALAEWAAQTFNFTQKPSQATISRLLKNRITISKSRTPDTAKRATVPRQPALEDALFSWVVAQKVRRGRVTSGTVREFGRLLLRHVNERLPGGRHLEFRFSNGWMEKYKKRYGLKFWRANEDPEDENDGSVFDEGYPSFVRKLSTFTDNDIWTAAEFGVQYCMNSDASTHDESKLTILACSNKTGSERYPLTMIGKSSTKLSIDAQTTKNINFEYLSNINAWLTAKLFFSWLHAFDAYIGRNRERKVLLVLDSCSAHGNHETVPALKNVEILFLPTSSIAKTLPMECGIVSTIKLRFKRQQLLGVLDRVDQGDRHPFYVNPLVAMRWLTHEWKTLSSTIIQSCWQQSLGNIDADKHQFLVESSREEAYEINELLNEVARVCGRVNIRSLLYSPDERDCIETVNLETLRDSVVDRLVSEKANSQAFSLPEVPVLPSVNEQLKAFAIVRQVLDERGMIDSNLRTAVRDVQRAIRTEQAAKTGRTMLFGFRGSHPARQAPQSQPVPQVRQTQTDQPSQPAHSVRLSQQTHLAPQIHPPQSSQPSLPSQSPPALQPPEQSQQSQPCQQAQQAQQTQQSEKNQVEMTNPSVLDQVSTAVSIWTRYSKAHRSAKSSEVLSRDQEKATTDIIVESESPAATPDPKGSRLNDSLPPDIPILTIADDESAMRDEESGTAAEQMEMCTRPVHSAEHSNDSVPEAKGHCSETPSQVDVGQPVNQEHTVHGEPQVDGSQMEFSHPDVIHQEHRTDALEISEAPS